METMRNKITQCDQVCKRDSGSIDVKLDWVDQDPKRQGWLVVGVVVPRPS